MHEYMRHEKYSYIQRIRVSVDTGVFRVSLAPLAAKQDYWRTIRTVGNNNARTKFVPRVLKKKLIEVHTMPVSYTHLTLPTILLV